MCGAIKSTVQLFMRSHKNMHHPSVLWEKLGTASSVLMFLKGKHPYHSTTNSKTNRPLSNFVPPKKVRKNSLTTDLEAVELKKHELFICICIYIFSIDVCERGGRKMRKGVLGKNGGKFVIIFDNGDIDRCVLGLCSSLRCRAILSQNKLYLRCMFWICKCLFIFFD